MEMRSTSSTDVPLCFAAAQSGTTTYQHTSERGEKDLQPPRRSSCSEASCRP